MYKFEVVTKVLYQINTIENVRSVTVWEGFDN
jgi:hypothetical protein